MTMRADVDTKSRLGVRGKLVALFAFFVIAVGIAVLSVAVRLSADLLRDNLSRRAAIYASDLASQVADKISSADPNALDPWVAKTAEEPDVILIAIRGTDNSPLIERAPKAAESSLAPAYEFGSRDGSVGTGFVTIRELGELAVAVAPVVSQTGGSGAVKTLGEVRVGLSTEGVNAALRGILWKSALAAMAIFAIGAALVPYAVRRFLGPLERMAAVARRVAKGDFTPTVEATTPDEVGEIGASCSEMTRSLSAMIHKIRAAHQDVTMAAEDIQDNSKKIAEGAERQQMWGEKTARSVEQMNGSFKEIASGVSVLSGSVELASSSILELSASIGEVAGSTSGLSSAVDDTSSSIIQMASSIKQVADHAGALSAASQDTASAIKEISASVKEVEERARESARVSEKVTLDAEELGVKSIEKTIDGMARIKGTIDQATEVVNRLGERSEHIGKILTVIEEVTKQTNLLALNAAILAAQAGEHGKGFSVVAGEIKKLSNRTTASTNEIVEMITAIQKEVKEAVSVIREGAVSAEMGMKLSSEAGSSLRKLLEGARRSTAMAVSIEGTTVEQVKGIRQVADAVERVSVMSQQIETATQEQHKGAELIMRTSERMRDITRQVRLATEEQAKGSRQITGEVESVTEKVQSIAGALDVLRTESQMISQAIGEIREVSKHSVELSREMDSAVEALKTQARVFEAEMSHFQI